MVDRATSRQPTPRSPGEATLTPEQLRDQRAGEEVSGARQQLRDAFAESERNRSEIIRAFDTEASEQRQRARDTGPIMAMGRGANTGLATVAGLPADLSNLAAEFANEQIGGPAFGRLPGGSRDIKNMLARVGILTDLDIERSEMPNVSRGFFAFGETFNAAIPFAAAPFAAARLTTGTGPIREAVRTQPGAFARTEMSSAFGAGQLGGLAEAAAPGRPGVRMGAEVAGGILAPVSLLQRTAGRFGSDLRAVTQGFTRAGKLNRAAGIIQDVVVNSGDDPARLARILQAREEFGIELTAGLKTGSPVLRAMEREIARRSPEFNDRQRSMINAANERLRGMVDDLVATGDPGALRMAAQLRKRHTDQLIADRIRLAEQRAAEASARVGQVSGARRAAASRTQERIMREALSELREVESSLYEKIPRTLQSDASHFRARVDQARSQELLPEDSLPLESTVSRITEAGEGATTSGELLILRGRLREEARSLRGSDQLNQARIADSLADAVERDIGELGIPVADEARQFSISLNDAFTRTFAGKQLRREASGAQRVSPEEAMSIAFRGSPEGRAGRFAEVEEAAAFADSVARGHDAEPRALFRDAVRNEQEAFLRDMASQIFDSQGRVNPESLNRFVANNDALLSRFPEVQANLRDAESAERLLQQVERTSATARKRIDRLAAFSRLADVEDPAPFIGRVLAGERPASQYRQLARMAHDSGRGAVAGLRTATLDQARNLATSTVDGFSFRRMRQALFRSPGEGRKSTMRLMRDNDVMSTGEADRLERLLGRAIEIEDALSQPGRVGELVGEPDPMFDLVVRMVGANIGGAAARGQAAGTPIVLAGAGSRFARRMLEKVPATRTLDVIQEAVENPDLMAELLLRPSSQREVIQQGARIQAFLIQAGLVPKSEAERPPAIDSFVEFAEIPDGPPLAIEERSQQ